MIESAYRLASSLEVERRQQELTASNIAGAQIPGYKARHINSESFQQELSQQTEDTLGSFGVKANEVKTYFGDAAIKNTSRPLDFALSGDGFFQVQTPDGENLLTRTGRFHVSADGTLQTAEGYDVMGDGGRAIELPEDVSLRDLSVRGDGTLTVTTTEGGSDTLGKLAIGTVEDKQQLTRLSAKYFRPQEQQQVTTPEDFSVLNKCYETANVSPIREMTEMIETARRFQTGNKMIKMLRTISRQEIQKMS